MPAAKKAKKNVDVRKPEDRKELQIIIETHPITFILVHADWCGHCQTFKEKVWSKLEELPDTKNGLAAIHHDQLEGTEFADAKIRGYPSVIVVGKKKLAEFEDEDGKSNAIPSEQANDVKMMTDLVTSGEPATLPKTLKGVTTNVDIPSEADEEGVESKNTSAELDEDAKLSRQLKSNSGSKKTVTASPFEVPDPGQDVLDTQEAATASTEFEKADAAKADAVKVGGGGSLYHSLLAATRDVAAPAALVAAAVLMKRSKRRITKRRGAKRGGKKRVSRRRSL